MRCAAIMTASGLALAAVPASAQWSVTVLEPAGATSSIAAAGHGAVQCGTATINGSEQAGLWQGTAGSWVRLPPFNSVSSCADTFEGRAVGNRTSGSVRRAMYWPTTTTYVELHPTHAFAFSSWLEGMDGAQQVGYVNFMSGAQIMAGVWSGTAESFVNLHPASSFRSQALKVKDGRQVGNAWFGSVTAVPHAALWSGTAASFIDLNPPGAARSEATAIDTGVQGGHAMFGTATHALLWRGAAADYTDLNPAGAASSAVYGAGEGYQVGSAVINGVQHACLWQGTAASFEDLFAVLPRAWTNTQAQDVWTHAGRLYASGSGRSNSRTIALLWSRPLAVPTPCGTADFNGDDDTGTDQDIEAFFACLGGHCCATCFTGGADFNGDGDHGTDQDIEAFFRVLGGGPC